MKPFIQERWGKNEYFILFLLCSLPVHIWAYLSFLEILPVTLLQMSLWNILGVAAYVIDFALLESLFIFGLLFFASLFLPVNLLNLRALHILAILIFATSIVAWLIHLYTKWQIDFINYSNWIILWVLAGSGAFILAISWLRRNQRNQEFLQSGIERLAMLSMVYISFDFLGVFVILIRNILPQ